MFKYFLYRLGQFLVKRFSLKTCYRIAMFFSTLQYYCSPRDRRAVKNNLRVIVGEKADIAFLAREVFRNFGKYLAEFFGMGPKLDRRYVEQHVTVKNLSYIEHALKQGRGGIILTAHLGNWELGGIILGALGYPLLAVALPHKERPVNELFNKQREARGLTILPLNRAVRACIDTLQANKLIALVGDRDFTTHGVMMDFLGRKALIPKGAAIFSLKTGAPIIPCFLIRQKDDTFILSIEPPLYPSQIIEGTIEDNLVIDLMGKYITCFEQNIKLYPTQWLMFREFWSK